MVDSVILGTSSLFDAYFYEDDNTTPLNAVGGVSYTVTAFNNMLITSGIAEQDAINLARWKLNLVIPLSAPATGPNDYYTLAWRAKDAKTGNIYTQRDRFTVLDASEQNDTEIDGTTIALLNQPFNLTLSTYNPTVASLSLRIIREGSDSPIITLTNLTDSAGQGISPKQDGNIYKYNIPITGGILNPINGQRNQGGFNTYFAYYNYLDNQENQQTVINPLYIVNSTLIGIMNSVNQYCNMLKNRDVVTQLQITESKLVHFSLQGLLKVNATSPGNFGFDLNTLGRQQTFYFWTIKCAQLELLRALSLAEGMSAFEFSGMTVQLNSDRTQYINNAIQELQSDIDNQLPKVKSQWARGGAGTGKMGVIGLNFGPAMNFPYFIGGNFGNGLGLGFGGDGFPSLPFLI